MAWLNLASILLLSACFGSHGGTSDPDGGSAEDTGTGADTAPPPPDAGPDSSPIDGGPMCTVGTPYVESLRCPSTVLEGTSVRVSLTVTNPGCCSDGEVTTELGTGPMGEVVIESLMRACDCCDLCDCIGPTLTTDVDVAPLPVGSRVVRAGDQTCTIEVRPAEMCSSHPIEEVRIPRALFPDQDLPVSLISRVTSGCSCTPRVTGTAEALDMEVCSCCEACRCIDSGYEAGEILPPLPVGDHDVGLGITTQPVTVRRRESCAPTTDVTSIRIEQTTDLIHGGPALTWAVVETEATVCCTQPLWAVESVRSFDGIELTAHSCPVPDPCDCAPVTPTPFETWHSLGELPPGTYSVTLPGTEGAAFTID